MVPPVFHHDELERLRAAARDELAAVANPGRILEDDGITVRAVHGGHRTNPVMQRLVEDHRVLDPVMQLSAGDVYVHQFKVNAKAAFEGGAWEWHQDFHYWHTEDGMPEPRATNVAVFLDDTSVVNGPLMVIPGSHTVVLTATEVPAESGSQHEWQRSFTPKLKYRIDRAELTDLAARNGIATLDGEPGSLAFFHCQIVHGSAANLSPFDRTTIITAYNPVDNALRPVPRPRPEFLASREFTPVEPSRAEASGARR